MDYAAIAAGLVLRDRGFLVKDNDAQPGSPERKRPSDRKSDDAGTDNSDVRCAIAGGEM
jgi:hypothetical protein